MMLKPLSSDTNDSPPASNVRYEEKYLLIRSPTKRDLFSPLGASRVAASKLLESQPESISPHPLLSLPSLRTKSDLSPEKALAQLRRIQRHRVRINAAPPISGISTINAQQSSVFAALNLKKPTQDAQLSLL